MEVSIIVPTYNRAALLPATLTALLHQDSDQYEIILVDDGSTDDTTEGVAPFVGERLRYVKKINGERGAARNYGAQLAQGKYINFFDSDDIAQPHHVSTAIKMIREFNQPEFFSLSYDIRAGNGVLKKEVRCARERVAEKILFDNQLSCNGVFVRKDIVASFPFNENRTLASSEDWELWIRLIARFPLHVSDAITSTLIEHENRSLRTIKPDQVIARDQLLIELLSADKEVMKKYGDRFSKFVAERFTFFMLCLAEAERRSEVLGWAKRAMNVYPRIVFSKRFLASIKNTVL